MEIKKRHKSSFQEYRQVKQPELPEVFKESLEVVSTPVEVDKEIQKLYPALMKLGPNACTFKQSNRKMSTAKEPLRIGCVLSGGQAAGGHNVIAGLYRYIKEFHPNSQLFGFKKGPIGIIKNVYEEILDDKINYYLSTGGFDMILSGRDKIETEEQYVSSMKNCQALKLDGLVVIGGDDSNTNACNLAEYFAKNGCNIKVVGCPKTIDGDLKNKFIDVSFGFDTACKIYSELIGTIMMDTLSSKNSYHFVRLMGRSASHIALECAHLTRPNWCFVGEEVQDKKMKLMDLTKQLVDIIVNRYKQGKNYGVFLIPEGLIEFIQEVKILISEINTLFVSVWKSGNFVIDLHLEQLYEKLSPDSRQLLKNMPAKIREQLLLDRDAHGNVQVAKIDTEILLILLVEDALEKQAEYKGKFLALSHYFGYEGRCGFPSQFDSTYCYSLGYNAGMLIKKDFTGVMSVVQNTAEGIANWQPAGYPLITMMNLEDRGAGKFKQVIKKYLVELDKPMFLDYAKIRDEWAIQDHYQAIGPCQFEYPNETPYIVKPKQNMYNNEKSIKYEKNVPYHPIDPKCMSELALRRLQKDCLPHIISMFDGENFKTFKKNVLDFADKSVEIACSKRFNKAFIQSSSLVEVQVTNTPIEHRKGMKIGICFNGRQAPGCNNITYGLLKFCQKYQSKLLGFIEGTKGLYSGNAIEITEENIKYYVNQGGQALLGRKADQMRAPKELEDTKATCVKLDLDGLIIVGASHSLTDALILTNYFLEQQTKTCVIGVPASIDNNIGHHMLESVVGFDTASKVYSQLIGNLNIDTASAIKYFYFIRLMSRDPSHLALESALECHPNITLISEEIAQKGWNMDDVVKYIADIVMQRHEQNKNYGTLLIPEGLLAHLPEFKEMINEINKKFQEVDKSKVEEYAQKLLKDEQFVKQELSAWVAARFLKLPQMQRKEMLLKRDQKNNFIELQAIETQKLLADLVKGEIKRRMKVKNLPLVEKLKDVLAAVQAHLEKVENVNDEKKQIKKDANYLKEKIGEGLAKLFYEQKAGIQDFILNSENTDALLTNLVTDSSKFFQPMPFYMGHQGRSAMPTIFDSELGANYGYLAGVLVSEKLTGYCTTIRGVNGQIHKWYPGAIPLVKMTNLKAKSKGYGENQPLIPSYEVDLNGAPFKLLKSKEQEWQLADDYLNPGPIQYFGKMAGIKTVTLQANHGEYLDLIKKIEELSEDINSNCRFGTHQEVLKMTINHLELLKDTLRQIRSKYI